MSEAARTQMNAEEFLAWRQHQDATFELVDGAPVLKFDNGSEMMAGGTRDHALVCANLLAALRPQLRGGPCLPFPADLAVRVSATQVRQPDVTVDCRRGRGGDLTAAEPTLLFEVLSPSARRFDLLRKTNEYQRLASVRQFVLLEPDQARALVWTREIDTSWSATTVEGLEASLDLSSVDVVLPMMEVYEDVELRGGG